MAELKTQRNYGDVEDFLDSLDNEKRKADAYILLEIMKKVTGKPAEMWGTSIVGFGSYHYKYASGREGDWFVVGFSPRKQSLSLYLMSGFDHHEALLNKLGKYRTGKSCLYINKIEDVDVEVLEELIRAAVENMDDKTCG